MFKKLAADVGIVMNQNKEEHQVGFCWSSVTSMRMLHKGGQWLGNMEKLSDAESLGYTVNLQL